MISTLPPTRIEIERINASFSVALRRGDAAGMAAVYTTDAQLLPPHGAMYSGRAEIQSFWQGVIEQGIVAADLETLEFEAYGNMAWEVGKGVLKGKDGQVRNEVKYLVIWKREQGVWRWHRNIWNSNRPVP